MKNVYKQFGLQEEFNEINEYYNIDTNLDLNDSENIKNIAITSIEYHLNNGSVLSHKILKAALNFTLFFSDLINECDVEEFIKVLGNDEDTFKTLKGFTDAFAETQALNKSTKNCVTLFEKKHTINICLKSFQDLTSCISEHLTYIMKLINVKNIVYSKKDYNSRLVDKINKLTGKNEYLDKLLELTDRKLRNKIGHGDIYYDFEECVFKTKTQKTICNYKDFQESNFNSFAFESGLMLSYQMLNLLYLNEIETLKKYAQRIDEIS
ncbi:hypothetical protein CF086_17390 [Clostridium botulinum]|uniref:hypothetical protein n=1 Tax=Clostridium botulinum TaxID=1491 RepID=UPI000774932F|nr:hypothetical protein [Clostridium botulinum]MBN3352072.1 hypothetical protein [Clostridium botulinum]